MSTKTLQILGSFGAAEEHTHLSEDIADLAQISKTASYEDLEGAPVLSLNNIMAGAWDAGQTGTYRIGNILIQGATSPTFKTTASAVLEQTYTFPIAYKTGTKPLIVVNPYYNSTSYSNFNELQVAMMSWDNTSFKIGASSGTKSFNGRIQWVAIGEIAEPVIDDDSGETGESTALTYTSGASHSQTTFVGREIMEIPNVAALSGTMSSVDLKYNLRVGTTANFTYTIYLFKTLNLSADYWNDRGDYWYNYPLASNPKNQYFKASFAQDVLATLTVTEKVATGAKTQTITNFTEYGQWAHNWEGTVYFGIVCDNTDLYWGNSTTSTMTINYDAILGGM